VTGYVLHPEVFDDLDQIYEYIGSFNASAADRVLDELFAAFDSLPPFPHQGHHRPEFTSHPLRFKVV
jgi:plasmid stabilization system protein ParE